MKLHFHPMSGNSRRALLVATHLGVPLERALVDLTKGEQHGPTHAARNPNERVPVLEDGELVLWESRAIMMYLCDGTPGQALLPTDAAARADVTRWLFWCSQHMQPACGILVQENFVKALAGRGAPDPVEVARGEALFTHNAAILDAHLQGKTWVAQDRLTLADYSIAASFALRGPARFAMEPYANLRAWLERVESLDAWKQTAPQKPTAR